MNILDKLDADIDVEKHALSSPPPPSYFPLADPPALSTTAPFHWSDLLSLHRLATHLDWLDVYGWAILASFTLAIPTCAAVCCTALRSKAFSNGDPETPTLDFWFVSLWVAVLMTLVRNAVGLVQAWMVRKQRGREEWMRFLQEIWCVF